MFHTYMYIIFNKIQDNFYFQAAIFSAYNLSHNSVFNIASDRVSKLRYFIILEEKRRL